MKVHNEIQGTPAWLQLRRNFLTASEAAAMMGDSPLTTRNELLAMKITGTDKEFSDYVQKFILDKGHEVEAKARPIAEEIIGDDLFPITGSETIDGLDLLASYDGLTMLYDNNFEHKQWNQAKVDVMKQSNELLPEFYWQLEHQLLVCNGNKTMFVMSNGTESKWFQKDYYSVPERRAKLIASWKQFKKDMGAFEVKPEEVKPEADTIKSLPALLVQINGEVTSSNLDIYKNTALTFINNINTDLQTDQQFSDAEETVKFCKNAEHELQATKKQALAQTASIDELFKTVDFLSEELRKKRLYLDKLVKSKKAELKGNILKDIENKFNQHTIGINQELGGIYLPDIDRNFAGTIKGKRTISSIQNAVDTELARVKIEADQIAMGIRKNLTYFGANKDYKFLFNDLHSLVVKACDDFSAIVDNRINNHKAEEEKRLQMERERIKKEEERKAQAKLNAEREAIRKEEQAKAEQERIRIANTERERKAKEHEEYQTKARIEYEQGQAEHHKNKDNQAESDRTLAEPDIQQQEDFAEENNAYEEQTNNPAIDGFTSTHRPKIRKAALDGFVSAGIDVNTAKKVISLIAKGQISHISINY